MTDKARCNRVVGFGRSGLCALEESHSGGCDLELKPSLVAAGDGPRCALLPPSNVWHCTLRSGHPGDCVRVRRKQLGLPTELKNVSADRPDTKEGEDEYMLGYMRSTLEKCMDHMKMPGSPALGDVATKVEELVKERDAANDWSQHQSDRAADQAKLITDQAQQILGLRQRERIRFSNAREAPATKAQVERLMSQSDVSPADKAVILFGGTPLRIGTQVLVACQKKYPDLFAGFPSDEATDALERSVLALKDLVHKRETRIESLIAKHKTEVDTLKTAVRGADQPNRKMASQLGETKRQMEGVEKAHASMASELREASKERLASEKKNTELERILWQMYSVIGPNGFDAGPAELQMQIASDFAKNYLFVEHPEAWDAHIETVKERKARCPAENDEYQCSLGRGHSGSHAHEQSGDCWANVADSGWAMKDSPEPLNFRMGLQGGALRGHVFVNGKPYAAVEERVETLETELTCKGAHQYADISTRRIMTVNEGRLFLEHLDRGCRERNGLVGDIGAEGARIDQYVAPPPLGRTDPGSDTGKI